MKHIYFTVTNDLTYDRRMHRICESLVKAGYSATLVGRQLPASLPLQKKSFRQKRLYCFFTSGFSFYTEYNIRLFFFLLFKKMDCICAIDLDTILPCLAVSKIKRVQRVYDAHEYFSELKEVISRPLVHRFWLLVERIALRQFRFGYTVSEGIQQQFAAKYHRRYAVVRNLPRLQSLTIDNNKLPVLLYQGAVNHGRCFEYIIPALRYVPYKLVICGDGNFMPQLKQLIRKHDVQNKVELKGMLLPEALPALAQTATLGIVLIENTGLNQLLSLPNKFFDYMHAGLPQIAMCYPEYEKINQQFEVAILLPKLTSSMIADTIIAAMQNETLLKRLQKNCLAARQVYNWQNEEKVLIAFYKNLLHD